MPRKASQTTEWPIVTDRKEIDRLMRIAVDEGLMVRLIAPKSPEPDHHLVGIAEDWDDGEWSVGPAGHCYHVDMTGDFELTGVQPIGWVWEDPEAKPEPASAGIVRRSTLLSVYDEPNDVGVCWSSEKPGTLTVEMSDEVDHVELNLAKLRALLADIDKEEATQ